ncbi:hypothetical protein OG413_40495 [Streptomyces sp. NBC_01433]|uniref:hypothetical protein n=1 Tax=Streptomyces sp. NBC_01433 TaxID=2903864 RepID=UPI002255BCBA|nr:hypothetical protein [Streptomyces sp. NBC_01433]MCX4681481.1 hypothetical protein [Streptomyces sp. NBC_01433]
MTTATNWLEELPALDDNDLRLAHRRSRDILLRLGADRRLLTQLVGEIEHDPQRMTESEVHPLINRLVIYQDDARGFQIRLHMSPGARELVPHDHKYTFTTLVLAGAYIHVWRRRTDGGEGEFTAEDLQPGLITVERPGSCYTLGHPLVHQTVMLPGTVTLFMRGPRAKTRSNAALDMLPAADEWPEASQSGKPKHARGQRPVTAAEYHAMRRQLVAQEIITS